MFVCHPALAAHRKVATHLFLNWALMADCGSIWVQVFHPESLCVGFAIGSVRSVMGAAGVAAPTELPRAPSQGCQGAEPPGQAMGWWRWSWSEHGVVLCRLQPGLPQTGNRRRAVMLTFQLTPTSSFLLFFPACVWNPPLLPYVASWNCCTTLQGVCENPCLTGKAWVTNVSVQPKTTGESGWLLWASEEVF